MKLKGNWSCASEKILRERSVLFTTEKGFIKLFLAGFQFPQVGITDLLVLQWYLPRLGEHLDVSKSTES